MLGYSGVKTSEERGESLTSLHLISSKVTGDLLIELKK